MRALPLRPRDRRLELRKGEAKGRKQSRHKIKDYPSMSETLLPFPYRVGNNQRALPVFTWPLENVTARLRPSRRTLGFSAARLW